MPKCFVCHVVVPTARDLCHHFKYIHANRKFDYYECVEIGCNRKYFLLNSFIKHLKVHSYSNNNSDIPIHFQLLRLII